MKITLLVLLSLLLTTLLSACSNKPKDVSKEYWNEAIQIILYVDEQTNEDKSVDSGLVNGLKVVPDELSKGERGINRDLFILADFSGSYVLASPTGDYKEEYKQQYDEAYSKLESLFGSSTIEKAQLDEAKLENIIAKYKDVGAIKANAKNEADSADRERERERIKEIKNSNPSLGMTKAEVEMSLWGKPKKVNRTVNQNGTTEQWVYGNSQYLNFTDGILTSFQD